jgi:hypothetical protein
MIKKILFGFSLSIAALALGCTKAHEEKHAKDKESEAKKPETAKVERDKDAEIRANLALLSEHDRALAEEQKFCAVNTKSRLGSMDKPIKIELEGQPVFLCCSSCEKEAKADPKKTLEKVAELKAKK